MDTWYRTGQDTHTTMTRLWPRAWLCDGDRPLPASRVHVHRWIYGCGHNESNGHHRSDDRKVKRIVRALTFSTLHYVVDRVTLCMLISPSLQAEKEGKDLAGRNHKRKDQ
jgi:hypothetical protein